MKRQNPTKPYIFAGCLLLVLAAYCSMPSIEASVGHKAAAQTVSMRGRYNGKLVFTSDRHNAALNIWTMNSDGSSPRRLTHLTPRGDDLPPFARVYDDLPVWSPDGTKIAFITNRDYAVGSTDSSRSIYIMDADGSNVNRILVDGIEETLPEIRSVAWSPDGTKFAFDAGVHVAIPEVRATINIYTVNTDGTNIVKLTNDTDVVNVGPTWSPDGRQIAYASNRDPQNRYRIWVMNSDGSGPRKLADVHNTLNPLFYYDLQPAWSPDGTRILFVGSRDFNGTRDCFNVNCLEMFVVNPDGSNEQQLTNDQNRGGLQFLPRWSPDGTKIVFSVDLRTVDDSIDRGRAIIVMNADGSNQINLSNRSDYAFSDVSVDWQPLPVPANEPPPAALSFSAPSYSAFEDSGSIPITVTRTGNLNESVSCFYATEDGTATVRRHYAPAFGTLRFAPGEASRTILIPLTDNGHVWGNRSFKIALFDNEGNATFLGGIREANITVLERDAVPRPNNPIDDARAFVRQHYVDFLNREPDPEGLAFWANEIASCGTDARCLDIKRQHVSAAFFLSIEFQETGYFVLRYRILNYSSEYPSGGFFGFARYAQEVGRGVVVGQAGWQERLEANKRAFIQRFFDDDRIALSFGRTDEEYVDLLFQYVREFAGVTLPQSERDALVAGLTAGTETRPTVFRRVLENEQFKRGFFNQAFVLMQYYGYLRRDPDEAGYFFWLNKLDRFGGDYIAAEMVKAFIISGEYRNRFGQP
ncbi:MAG: DUF4214 domain-containing protein [Acidobacteriota bacterium]|nr:DUF4214 domain-containing protein [Acidobacteriota bacterium]